MVRLFLSKSPLSILCSLEASHYGKANTIPPCLPNQMAPRLLPGGGRGAQPLEGGKSGCPVEFDQVP